MDIHVPLEAIAKDVHYAVRGLRRNPGFTAAAILAEDFDELRANGSVWDPNRDAFQQQPELDSGTRRRLRLLRESFRGAWRQAPPPAACFFPRKTVLARLALL